MNNAQLINQNSGKTDYRTPQFIDAARKCMGSIDLDPASSMEANESVGAEKIYCEPETFVVPAYTINGLSCRGRRGAGAFEQLWIAGSVFMNHPFGAGEARCEDKCRKKICPQRGYHILWDQEGNEDWIQKLVCSYREGCFRQSCNITFASTSEAWFQPLMEFPQCYLSPRTNYRLPDGTLMPGVPKGSVVTYLGPRIKRFAACFEKFGAIKIALKPARRRK